MYSEDNIPVNLQAAKEESKPPMIVFNPISKKWKAFIGLLLFLNTVVFLHTAYAYYIFKDAIATMALALQANLIHVLLGIVSLFVNISVLFAYFYFRKRRSQERADIPTSKYWKILFILLPILYLVLAGVLTLSLGGILSAVSVITDSIIATYNIIILLIYFDRHQPRKVFYVLGNVIIYLSLVFIIVGIILQSLSTLSFFIG